jgi:hypothetical protein
LADERFEVVGFKIGELAADLERLRKALALLPHDLPAGRSAKTS